MHLLTTRKRSVVLPSADVRSPRVRDDSTSLHTSCSKEAKSLLSPFIFSNTHPEFLRSFS